jgi:hypothetical protein
MKLGDGIKTILQNLEHEGEEAYIFQVLYCYNA